MKFSTFYKLVPAIMLGLVVQVLRAQIYTYGMDEQGLLTLGDSNTLMLLGASVVAVIYAVYTAWPEKGTKTFEDNFTKGLLPAVGCWILAVTVLIWGIRSGEDGVAAVAALHLVLALASAVGLAYMGYCRMKGQKPFFAAGGVVTVYFAIHAVLRYQSWSSNPQMLDYIFALLGCVCMMLYAYQLTAFSVDMGSRRVQIALALAGISFCMASVPQGEYVPMYLAGAVWMATNLCCLEEPEKE